MRLVCVALLLAGCSSNLYLHDDEGAEHPDPPSTGDRPDELSQPYALGTTVGLTLERADAKQGPWRVVSDAPSIVAVDPVDVDNSGNVHTRLHALAEGVAT